MPYSSSKKVVGMVPKMTGSKMLLLAIAVVGIFVATQVTKELVYTGVLPAAENNPHFDGREEEYQISVDQTHQGKRLREPDTYQETTPVKKPGTAATGDTQRNFISPASHFSSPVTYYADQHSSNTHVTNAIRKAYPGSKQVGRKVGGWQIACCANVHMGDQTHDWKLEHPTNIYNANPNPFQIKQMKLVPCEAYRDSAANKRQLCSLSHEFPSVQFTPKCKILSSEDSIDTAINWLQQDTNKLWVLKNTDSGKHRGTGVTIDSASKIIDAIRGQEANDHSVLQEYIVPEVFPKYKRKVEFRQYLITTSLEPLRLYAGGIWLSHAPSPYDGSYEKRYDRCIHLNHAHRMPGESCTQDTLSSTQKQQSLEQWAQDESISASVLEKIRSNIDRSTTALLLSSAKDVHEHPWVKKLGAATNPMRCLSYLRADIALEKDTMNAFIVELNEFPYLNEEVPSIATMQQRDALDMFHTFGVIQKDAEKPLSSSQLAIVDKVCERFTCTGNEYQELGNLVWELNHKGGLRLLHPKLGQEIARAEYFKHLPSQQRFMEMYGEILKELN